MRRQQAQRQRLTDVLNLPRFVDLPSDDQRVAIRLRSAECADDASIPSCRKHPNDRHVMDDIIRPEFGRKLLHVARLSYGRPHPTNRRALPRGNPASDFDGSQTAAARRAACDKI
jgi:hypothetical protein